MIRVHFNDTATLYAVIRNSDGEVWDTSEFVIWADVDIADYAIALDNQGGDLYSVDFPVDINPGKYSIAIYRQDGASPAVTDTLIVSGQKDWNGKNLTTPSGDVVLSANALCSVERVLRLMGDKQADIYDVDLLIDLINEVSSEMISDPKMVGSSFGTETRTEVFSGRYQNSLHLALYPVTITGLIINNEEQELTDFAVDDDIGAIHKKDGHFPYGYRNIQVTYTRTEEIPEHIAGLAARYVKGKWDLRSVDANLSNQEATASMLQLREAIIDHCSSTEGGTGVYFFE